MLQAFIKKKTTKVCTVKMKVTNSDTTPCKTWKQLKPYTQNIFSVKVIRERNSRTVRIILMRCFWKKSGKTFFLIIRLSNSCILDYVDFKDNCNYAKKCLIHTFFSTICTHTIPWSSNQFLKKLLVFRHLVELPSVATIFSSEIHLVTSF